MKCSEVRRLVSPYLDSELDEKTEFEIARHLEGCAACAAHFQAEEDLERAIGSALRRTVGDEEEVLRAALERSVERAVDRSPGRGWPAPRLVAGAAAALTAALLALVAWMWTRGEEGEQAIPSLVALAARDHEEFVSGGKGLDVLGGSSEEIDNFLREEIGVTLGVLRLEEKWTVDGARHCRLDGASVGFVSLRWAGRPVSLFVVPSAVAARLTGISGAASYRVGGTNAVLQSTEDGLRLAIGDVEALRLRELLRMSR